MSTDEPERKPPAPALIVAALRAPFTAASALPALIAAAWAWQRGESFSWTRAILAVAGAAVVHLAANVINDYFDWDASDKINRFATPFSGGSRSRLEGLVERRTFLLMGIVLLVIACGLAAGLVILDRPLVPLIGLAGALGGILYSARPVQLAGRGVGELIIFICFGPLITLGTGYAIEGAITLNYALIGLPMGFLVASILWINEFPDIEADDRAGKRTLVVRLGSSRARWGYVALVAGFAASVAALWVADILPVWSLACLLTLALAFKAVRNLWAHHSDPDKLVPSQAATIQMQAMAGLLLTAALVVEHWLG
jgi:1,4-dihydroxy-2-naphthoate octaprenyltransferase